MIFAEAVDTLLKQHNRITNRQVRKLTNLSKQTVATYLGRLVDNGHLLRLGGGRSLAYERIQVDSEKARYLPDWNKFWGELAEKDPDLRYVRVATSCARRQYRADAENLLSQYPSSRRLVLDFEGADDASVTFLRYLLIEQNFDRPQRVLTINLSPLLKQRIDLAGRLYVRAGEASAL
jgi:hypothetical protein